MKTRADKFTFTHYHPYFKQMVVSFCMAMFFSKSFRRTLQHGYGYEYETYKSIKSQKKKKKNRYIFLVTMLN